MFRNVRKINIKLKLINNLMNLINKYYPIELF